MVRPSVVVWGLREGDGELPCALPEHGLPEAIAYCVGTLSRACRDRSSGTSTFPRRARGYMPRESQPPAPDDQHTSYAEVYPGDKASMTSVAPAEAETDVED